MYLLVLIESWKSLVWFCSGRIKTTTVLQTENSLTNDSTLKIEKQNNETH